MTTKIERCAYYDHAGKWLLTRTHGPTGLPMADECCPHYVTRQQAREALREERRQEALQARQ